MRTSPVLEQIKTDDEDGELDTFYLLEVAPGPGPCDEEAQPAGDAVLRLARPGEQRDSHVDELEGWRRCIEEPYPRSSISLNLITGVAPFDRIVSTWLSVANLASTEAPSPTRQFCPPNLRPATASRSAFDEEALLRQSAEDFPDCSLSAWDKIAKGREPRTTIIDYKNGR
jgi:hypothetical protein